MSVRSCCITEAVTAITGIFAVAAIRAQHAERLDPVHAGKLDVHEHELGQLLGREHDAVLRRVASSVVVPLDLQHVAHELHVARIVFDDQYHAHGLHPVTCQVS